MLARVLAVGAVAAFGGYDLLPDLMERRSPASLRRGGTLPAVALTFDDGPHPTLTPQVLAALAAAEARATFFFVGRNVRAHPGLVAEVARAGHAIGVHTDTHPHAWLCPPARMRREMERGMAAIVEATGRRPLWFRPPYGAFNAVTRPTATALGLRTALWSCDAYDWLPGATAERIARRVNRGLTPGAIIDLHDGGQTPHGCAQMTVALPTILAAMRKRGLRAVQLGEFFGLPPLAG